MNVNQKSMDSIFEEIGKQLPHESAITICGGSAIILAHKSRESTDDIDCIECDAITMKLANDVCFNKLRVNRWFNEDVKVTSSYTPQLLLWRTPYKRFENLMVYLISGLALLCMKLKSFRPESNDLRDCKSLVNYCKMNNYSYEDVQNAYSKIYVQDATMNVEAEQFLKDAFAVSEFKLDNESIQSFIDMIEMNLITVNDVPEQFKSDIIRAMLKDRPYAQLVQECLDELGTSKTYFDVRAILPNTEIPKENLKDLLRTIV